VDVLWKGPTTRPNEPKATDVIDKYVSVEYRGIAIPMTKKEKIIWDSMTRAQKQRIWSHHKNLIKKGKVKQVEIEGTLVSVKNKQYGSDTSRGGQDKAPQQSRPRKAKSKIR
jgi:hypothetical protein